MKFKAVICKNIVFKTLWGITFSFEILQNVQKRKQKKTTSFLALLHHVLEVNPVNFKKYLVGWGGTKCATETSSNSSGLFEVTVQSGGKTAWEACTHQSTEQVHSLQYELLVADPGHSQILQLLVGDTQQLVPPYFLPLEGLDVLLQAVVQAWGNHGKTGKLSVRQQDKAVRTFCSLSVSVF